MAPRKAKQFSLPFPLSPATQGNYRSPAWQGRVELYARNYFTPSEYENIKRMSIKFLPMEARLIASQFATSHEHRKKIQKFIGSLYVYDLAFALLRDLRIAVQNVARQPDQFGEEGKHVITDLMNNIRGWRFVKLENSGGAAAAVLPPPAPVTHVNINGQRWNLLPGAKVPNEVQMRRLSSQQEIQMRSKGYVGIAGDYYTIERVPATMNAPRSSNAPGRPAGPGVNYGGDLFPYQVNANNQYAVESILHQLTAKMRLLSWPTARLE